MPTASLPYFMEVSCGGVEQPSCVLRLMILGIFHPYIHLGYAFEYNQPAIVAEAIAMACVHEPDPDEMAPIYIWSERLSREKSQSDKKDLRQIMEDVRQSTVLQASIDGDNSLDRSKNVVANATNPMVEQAAAYSISEPDLEERLYEMFDICRKKPRSSCRCHSMLTVPTSFANCNQAIAD